MQDAEGRSVTDSPMDARLIMTTGSGPGAGKSSLLLALVEVLADRGHPMFKIDEDAVWGTRQLGVDPVSNTAAWPEFHDLLHERDRAPTGEQLIATFEHLRRRLTPNAVWVQDWSWLDLAAMLPWGRTDEHGLREFARNLRAVASDLNPIVLYLRADIEAGLRRAVTERGAIWLRRHAGVSPTSQDHEDDLIRSVAATYRAAEHRRLRILSDGGWTTAPIDADASRSTVLTAALSSLELPPTRYC